MKKSILSSIVSSILKPVNRGAAEPPATRQYYRFDGLTNAVVTGDIPISVGTVIGMSFTDFVVTVQYRRFIGSTDFALGVDTDIAGDTFRLTGCSATLDGVAVESKVTKIPTDSQHHELIITSTTATSISRFMDISSGTGVRKVQATGFDFYIDDKSEHYYRVDDGAAALGVITNSGTGENATLINEVTGDWYEGEL